MKRILSITAIALTTSCFAQNVSNKITFPNGKKIELTSQVSSVISQEMMGQSMESKVNATVTRLFTVQNATASNASIKHQINRMQMTMESPMGAQSFDSDNPKDVQSDAGKEVAKTLNTKYSMDVDPTGKITAVKLDSNTAKAASSKDESNMLANALSGIVEGLNVPKVGDRSDFKILPDKDISKGTSWTDSLQNGLATFTVSNINDTAIFVTYKGTGSMERKQEMMGQEITITSKDTTSGTIVIDRKTGLLKSNTSTTDSKGSMEAMGQTIPMNTKTTRTITARIKD
jgi:hypothetical protein